MESLKTIEAFDATTYAPLIVDAASQAGASALERLIAEGRVRLIHDVIRQQLAELVASRTPAEDLTADQTADQVRKLLGSTPEWAFGNWVYYPWSARLVHVLPKSDYRFLRQDRNRYKITAKEQTRLAECCISIAGLSVGMATAATLALEGVGSHYRLADPDSLSLSNLNRMRTGIHNLGINKAVLAARELYEIDPYLDIEIFTDGVTDQNIDEFLGFEPSADQARQSDLLVEECDDLYMKVRLRERARELGIPVIMETSDRGLLDIERFDLEPKRPILHGALADTQADSLRKVSTKDKIPFILAIVDAAQASPATLGSMIEVKRSISTWPQLASAVALGGAVVTDTARRMLIGTLRESGRFSVDLDEIVRDGRGVSALSPALLHIPTADEACGARGPVPLPAPSGASVPTREEIGYIVAHAVLAPSGGNVQPWKFRAAGGVLDCYLDVERAASFLDFEGTASRVALGAAVENCVLCAASLGFATKVTPLVSTPGGFSRRLEFERSTPPRDPLFAQLYRRVTNRRKGDGRPFAGEDAAALAASLTDDRARLQLARNLDRRRSIGALLGRADKLTYLSKTMHAELVRELRWTPEEALTKRDGIDIATLDLSPADAAILRILRSWPALEFVQTQGGGLALMENARKCASASSAIALLTIAGRTDETYFEGGRALQRLWLKATERNLALHPWGLPYLFRRLARGGAGLADDEKRELFDIRAAFREIFDVRDDETEILMFCISYGGEPEARSLRRAIDDVLTFDV